MSNVKLTRIFIILFLIALACAFLFFGALCTNQTMKIFFVGQGFKNMKKDIYNIENERVKENPVVFLGDSITEMYDVEKHFKGSGLYVVNRGISSETSDETLDRLTRNVMTLSPAKVILLIGTNDLNKGATPDEIVDNITKIARHIKDFNEETEIFVESILPVNNEAYVLSKWIVNHRDNKVIDSINSVLKENAEYLDLYTYVDTASALKDSTKSFMDKRYTVDGLHISHEGYKVMTKVLLENIK